jgi:hypothetical protein
MLGWLLSGNTSYARIATPGATTADVRSAASSAVEPLERRIESLELACAGLWELLKFKMGCTDDELVAAVQAVDARDGSLDGRITQKGPEVCPKCGRTLLTKTGTRCSWCGEPLTRIPF